MFPVLTFQKHSDLVRPPQLWHVWCGGVARTMPGRLVALHVHSNAGATHTADADDG